MSTFIFSPLWAPLGVDTAVSVPPVGVTELASGLAPLFGDSTKRIWVYLPAGKGVWPSSARAPLVRERRSTRLAGWRTTSDHPASAAAAEPLLCTRTFSTVTSTRSKPHAGAS